MAKKKLTPLEREIQLRTRRIQRANDRIAEIESNAKEQIDKIKGEVHRDQTILDALQKGTK